MGEVHYELGTREPEELATDVREFWSRARTDASLRRELEDAGVTVDELLAVDSDDAIKFRHEGEGIDPTTVALVVAFAPAINAIVESAWKDVILPWIKKRRGAKAVGRSVEG